MLQRGTQATTLQLTPATEGRNQRGRGPTVQTPSFEKLVTHTHIKKAAPLQPRLQHPEITYTALNAPASGTGRIDDTTLLS
jgi:hypothetical protein